MADTADGEERAPIDRLREALGWRGDPRVDVVEHRHVRDYRRAIGLPPGGTEVPSTLYACFLTTEPPQMPAALAYGDGWLNGGDRFEVHRPLRLGDELHSQAVFTAVDEKHGRSGKMALLTFVTEFRLTGGALAARHVATRIRR